VAFITGMVILQVYLSRREGKWPGLILPMATFSLSVIPFVAILLFSIAGTSTSVTSHAVLTAEEMVELEAQRMEAYRIADYGSPQPVVTRHLHDEGNIAMSSSGSVAFASVSFMVTNIPTAILLIVYAVCRDKRKKLQALNRMSLQDL